MSIKPIDVKTTIVSNNESSRLRENQKTQELGQAHHSAQNQEKIQEKFENIPHAQASEHKAIRQEDQDAEREKSQPDTSPRKKKEDAEKTGENEEAAPIPDPQRLKGLKIDIKA